MSNFILITKSTEYKLNCFRDLFMEHVADQSLWYCIYTSTLLCLHTYDLTNSFEFHKRAETLITVLSICRHSRQQGHYNKLGF